MPVTINASPTNGLVQTADGSGVIKLQSNGVTTNALAWVNFNGTGTVAIRASYNVSSITDGGTGNYTVNFTTALADTSFSVAGTTGSQTNSGGDNGVICNYNRTTSSLSIYTRNTQSSGAGADYDTVNVAIFGN